MKKELKRIFVFFVCGLLLCAGALPARAGGGGALVAQGTCGLPEQNLLSVTLTVTDIGYVEKAAFILCYNPDVLCPDASGIIYSDDIRLSYDVSVPGELRFEIAPCGRGMDYGRTAFSVSFTVAGEGAFNLALTGGAYTDLQGNTGAVDARSRFVAKTTLSVPPALPEGTYPAQLRCGDVDFDRSVTAADARTILRAAVELETLSEAQTLCADIDGDESVTAADARLALRDAVSL